eukprot:TRINITY_DN8891_c0_g1_i2.p1 TRINITY_DN8891_c0_g1~~TRINITY_DN8891_c0_g1_i2.p1  ORF type:complete len:122 (+),score=9.18 TRINITY_DN8891_c0_g1_i2:142-507(+)
MNPEDPCLYTHRGNAYDDKGDWEFAIKDFNTAISLAPDYFYAFHNRGYVLTKRSQWERAYRDYTRALEISPDSATTLSNRGYVSVMKGKGMSPYQSGSTFTIALYSSLSNFRDFVIIKEKF